MIHVKDFLLEAEFGIWTAWVFTYVHTYLPTYIHVYTYVHTHLCLYILILMFFHGDCAEKSQLITIQTCDTDLFQQDEKSNRHIFSHLYS